MAMATGLMPVGTGFPLMGTREPFRSKEKRWIWPPATAKYAKLLDGSIRRAEAGAAEKGEPLIVDSVPLLKLARYPQTWASLWVATYIVLLVGNLEFIPHLMRKNTAFENTSCKLHIINLFSLSSILTHINAYMFN